MEDEADAGKKGKKLLLSALRFNSSSALDGGTNDWEPRMREYLSRRPPDKQLSRSVRQKAIACKQRRTSHELDDLREICNPDVPKLRRLSSNEAKQIAAPLVGVQYAGLLAEKNRSHHDFQTKKISKQQHRRANMQAGQSFNRYYASVVDGIKDRFEQFGRLAGPVTSEALTEQRISVVDNYNTWDQDDGDRVMTPRAVYKQRQHALRDSQKKQGINVDRSGAHSPITTDYI